MTGGRKTGLGGKQPARKFHCTEFSHFASAPLMSSRPPSLRAKSPIAFYSAALPPSGERDKEGTAVMGSIFLASCDSYVRRD